MEQALQSNPIPDAGIAAMQPAWTSAIERHRAGDTDGAIVLYQRHLKRNPQDAPGWMNLGAALRRTGRPDAALVCYQRALRLRPDDAAVWNNLGNLWRQFGEHEQSLRCHRRALQLAPAHPRLHLECAVSLREAGRFAEAEDIIGQCLAREPGRPDLLCERALLRLHTGRYAEAWPDYEARLRCVVPRLPRVEAPRWQGECIGGKRLLLQAEPGMADTLWAARFVAMLARRGADITLRCAAALHPVLAAMPVRLAPMRDGAAPDGTPDMHCPLLSLPGIVDPRGITIPEPVGIAVPEDSRAMMRRRIAPYARCFRIGVVWSGRGRQRADARASLPLERLLPLASLPGAQVFSLQKGHAATEQHSAGAAGFVVDLGAQCRHFGDTAAALEQMDLVVACDSAVAQLAGCMGKPVLALLAFNPHWIYGMHGDSTPWYPTMRLLRQKSPGDWSSVCTELLRLVGRWAEIRAVDPASAGRLSE
jgi:Flp pilus assembly protein TadD